MSIPGMISGRGKLVEVQQPIYDRTSGGGRLQTYSTVLTGVEVWFQPATSNLAEAYARRDLRVTHRAYVAQDLGLSEGWRLRDQEQKTYVVRGVVDMAGMGRLWRADVEQT